MTVKVVLARRASPAWQGLAVDYETDGFIAAERYFPFHDTRFDRRIPQFIERWNVLSRVSYFACRAELCAIANENLARVEGAVRVDSLQISDIVNNLPPDDMLLFYHDDDDWFSPDLGAYVASININLVDAVVFPFVRLASNVTTFTVTGSMAADGVGKAEAFRYRYCTNNHGLTRRALLKCPDLVEHTDASRAAETLGFVDLHLDRIISVTSKTPCSASWLSQLPESRTGFAKYISRYIEILESIVIPPGLCWAEQPLRRTLDLFRKVNRA
ncbi:hypothetical protein QE385_004024 [Sphingomonas sp. SORGH_AS 950]|uniref:hypothetical protein n=1 Tax=Sphingomonas sp. SORGH_AS_0950 TaxID=3041792 RepID=UPI002788C7F1|nr:hypothetical protein [Sphingomonas sp. SORGH_AS_0950]MDQ1159627.1 hypothetical protein [Sphingomonas sp. SORGH_AS_0950]